MTMTLQTKMRQNLAMTPDLQHSIWLLQLSGVEFEQAVEEALSNNPFLERDATEPDGPQAEPSESSPTNPADVASPTAQEDEPSHKPDDVEFYGASSTQGGARDDREEMDYGSFTAAPVALRDHLSVQVGVSRLAGRDRELAQLLVSALDPDGYLRQSFDDLRNLVSPPAQDAELAIALNWVQNLEPAGVGARTMVECVQLQLAQHDPETPGLDLARRMLDEDLEATAAHDLTRLKRIFDCDEQSLRAAYCLIRQCNPRPGASFGADDTRYVMADVIVRKQGKRWIASINPQAMPKIQLNNVYAEILQRQRGSSTTPMGQQLQEARWFVRNVEQRFQTIQRVAQAIVDRQSRFLDYGDIAMRPLVLRDIAEELGLHESTISRVTSNKYMAAPCGLFELKRFFGSHVESQGNACSSTAVRALIREIIAKESPDEPLSDIKLTRLLERQGVHIARRTVSKYRDAMHIPPVEARRMSMPA